MIMSNTPSYLDRIPFYVYDTGVTPPITGAPTGATGTPTGTPTGANGMGNWYNMVPGALAGVANIADVFWGQPDTYNYITEDNGGDTTTIIILIIIAVIVLYFLLKK
jgi:hypothetical protein